MAHIWQFNLWNHYMLISDGSNASSFRQPQMVNKKNVVKQQFLSCDTMLLFTQVYNSAETSTCKYRTSSLKRIGSDFMLSMCILEASVNIWWLALAPGRGTDRKWGFGSITLGISGSIRNPNQLYTLSYSFETKRDSETIENSVSNSVFYHNLVVPFQSLIIM